MATGEADVLFQLARRVRVLERAAAASSGLLDAPMLEVAARLLCCTPARQLVPSVSEMRQHLQLELGWAPSVAEARRILAAIGASPVAEDGTQ